MSAKKSSMNNLSGFTTTNEQPDEMPATASSNDNFSGSPASSEQQEPGSRQRSSKVNFSSSPPSPKQQEPVSGKKNSRPNFSRSQSSPKLQQSVSKKKSSSNKFSGSPSSLTKQQESSRKSSPKNNSSATSDSTEDFDELFDSFCKFGNRDWNEMTLMNLDKWFKQANIFSKNITTTDTAILFSKISKNKKKINKDEFKEMLQQLAQEKQVEYESLESKLKAAGKPSFSSVTRPIQDGVVAENMERLCNTSSYTGMHKQRFDEEGKGRGLSGRYEASSSDGYVQGYRNKGNYGSQENLHKNQDK